MKVQMQLLISRSYLVSKRLLDGVDSAGTGSRLWLYFRVSTQLYIFSTPDHLCTKYWRETYAFIPKAMKICVQFVSLLLITALPGWRSLCNSMKLCAMTCRATQDRRVIVKCPDKMWSTVRGNGKPLQYSCSKKPMNIQFSSVQFSRSVMSNSLWPHELQHTRPPCPSPTPRVHSNSRPLSQ